MRERLGMLVVVLAVTASSSAMGMVAPPVLAEARTAYEAGDFETAVVHYRDALAAIGTG